VETLQGELEGVRDKRLKQAERGLTRLHKAISALQGELGSLRDDRVAHTESDLTGLQAAMESVQSEVEAVRDVRLRQSEEGLAGLQAALATLQHEVERVRDDRLPRSEADVLGLHQALSQVQMLAEELRDGRLPAVAARTDALVAVIHEELAEVAGLVERLSRQEPLHVFVDPVVEAEVPDAIRRSSLRLITDFRGDTAEIGERVREYVGLLKTNQPVLELGPGRGELLEVLRDAGVKAHGVDSEAAMVSACRGRGLSVSQGDALEYLQAAAPGSLGAVVAIHVLEHLAAAHWMSVIDEAARVLRPGGALIVECPNPETLRVGGSLFWIDPTHRSPVHAQAVEFAARAVGLEVVATRFMRPFPADQALARPGQPDAVFDLASRLDAWLSGPRDFVVVARKPDAGGGKRTAARRRTKPPQRAVRSKTLLQ
jgi:SAM-dependent methyltransferase